MIDIGANLSNEQFSQDLDNVIKDAQNKGLKALILTSTDFKTYKINQGIIEKYSSLILLKTTYGLHPHNAKNSALILKNIKELKNNDVISIGEIGLDYFRMISPREDQLKVLETFMDYAKNVPEKPFFSMKEMLLKTFYLF